MSEGLQPATGAFSEGRGAFLRGLPRENCPYPPDATEREEWLNGWDRALAEASGARG